MTPHPATPPPRPDSLLALFGRRPRLLVVDDQADSREALAALFATDHEVRTAAGARDALQACAAAAPDLVLLDVVMPEVDGFQLCERLRSDPATRDIPVIFVTGQADDAAEARALDVGGVDFITKPVNPRVCRARVRTHLQLKRQADLLRSWVYVDGLTAIANRRCFEERAAAEQARAQRVGAPLSVLMIDLDRFKAFNDRHGHLAGDECMRRVAAALEDALKRPTDLLARYGGEEFVALLPDTGLDGALEVAARMRRSLQVAAIPHGAPGMPLVTASIGAACQTAGSPGDLADLLRAADERLYAAKAQGRDRACGAILGDAAPGGATANRDRG